MPRSASTLPSSSRAWSDATNAGDRAPRRELPPGREIPVPTLDGEPEKVTIPSGTQAGSEIKWRGRGLGRLGKSGRGDLVIRAGVAVPEKPTAKEKELLREYAELIGAPVGGGKN